jgi:Tfp pilus assembly protein PilF
VSLAEALIQGHQSAQAQQELERALLRVDKLGLKPLSAKANFILGQVFQASGNGTDAQQHYQKALRLLDEIHKESGAEKVLQRADFKKIYEEASRGTQTPKN